MQHMDSQAELLLRHLLGDLTLDEAVLLMIAHVSIRDRTYRLRKFRDCFVGAEAVNWMIESEDLPKIQTVEYAEQLGSIMCRFGYVSHVLERHDFKSKYYFYRVLKIPSIPKSEPQVTSAAASLFGTGNSPKIKRLASARRMLKHSGLLQASKQCQNEMLDRLDDIEEELGEQSKKLKRLQRVVCALLISLSILNSTGANTQGILSWGVVNVLLCAVLVELVGPWRGKALASLSRISPQGNVEDVEDDLKTKTQQAPKGVESSILPPPPSHTWPHRPLYVRLSPRVAALRITGLPFQDDSDSTPCVPPDPGCIFLNDKTSVFEFETDTFAGRALVRILNAPNTTDSSYFEGRKRTMQTVVQGRFKTPTPCSKVVTGQWFYRKLVNLPSRFILDTVFSIFKKLSPSLRADLSGGAPYFVSPLLATAQSVGVHPPGKEPCVTSELREETVLLGEYFAPNKDKPKGSLEEKEDEYSSSISSAKRKKYFSNPSNLQKHTFSPDLVYTFDFYQHMIVPDRFVLDLGITSFDMAKYLNGQPISIMAKNLETLQYYWDFEIWHQKLVTG